MANRILQLRAALDLTRAEFAKLFGVVRTTVQRWEEGTIKPSPYIEAAFEAVAQKHGIEWPLPVDAPTDARSRRSKSEQTEAQAA